MSRDQNNTEKARSDIKSSRKKYEYSPVTTDTPIPESLPELVRELRLLVKNSEDNQLSQADHDYVKDLGMILSGNGQFDFSQTMREKILESHCQPRRQNDTFLTAQEMALQEKTSKLLDLGITYEIIKILGEKEALKFINREIKDILGIDSSLQVQGQPEINSETSQDNQLSKNSSEYVVSSIQNYSGNEQQNDFYSVTSQVDAQENPVTIVDKRSESRLKIVSSSSKENQNNKPFQEEHDLSNLHQKTNNVRGIAALFGGVKPGMKTPIKKFPISKKDRQEKKHPNEFNLSEVGIVRKISNIFGGTIPSAGKNNLSCPEDKIINKTMWKFDSIESNTPSLKR